MADIDLSNVGPLQILAVDFDEPAFSGKIHDELQKLRDQKFIRIVDGVAVQKDESGNVIILEESDLSSEENEKYGAIIGGLIGIGSGDAEVARKAANTSLKDSMSATSTGLIKKTSRI